MQAALPRLTWYGALQATKQRARADLERATKARDALRNQTREMRGKIEYMTPEAIDEQISRLEERMNHSSMSLNVRGWLGSGAPCLVLAGSL